MSPVDVSRPPQLHLGGNEGSPRLGDVCVVASRDQPLNHFSKVVRTAGRVVLVFVVGHYRPFHENVRCKVGGEQLPSTCYPLTFPSLWRSRNAAHESINTLTASQLQVCLSNRFTEGSEKAVFYNHNDMVMSYFHEIIKIVSYRCQP